jgi:hypothetical protein
VLAGSPGCTEELNEYHHTATLTFHSAGTAMVRFSGLRKPGEDAVTTEYDVTVQ